MLHDDAVPARWPRRVGALHAIVCASVLLLAVPASHSALAEGRLEVAWIGLEPRLAPPNSLDAPLTEGWLEAGDRVHWVAHLLNRGSETVERVRYAWQIDDGTQASGETDVPPGESTLTLAWGWTFARHELAFSIDPPVEADEIREDNQLTVVTDALSLGLGVEQDVYDWLLEGDAPGFERLMQREIVRWNAILARAVHPTTPQGVLDRIRLDTVIVRPDGTGAANDDFSTDLRWFFASDRSDSRFLHRAMDPRYRDDQTIVLHELLHQRGLSDLYAYAVFHADVGRTNSRIEIAENGRLVAGTARMPNLNPASSVITVYRLGPDGLMGTRYRRGANLTEHSAFGLNLEAGRRSPQWFDRWGNLILGFGNAVYPDTYMSLIPNRTDVRLADERGATLANATVEIYLDHSASTYQNLYAATPDRVLVADGAGVVALSGDLLDGLPFKHDAPPKPLVLILGVKTPRARGYAFIPVYDLNLLHFRGQRERAQLELSVRMHPW